MLETLLAFVQFALAFLPFVAVALLIALALYTATKLFPEFGAWFNGTMDALMGTDAEYDERHDTGYASTHFDQYV